MPKIILENPFISWMSMGKCLVPRYVMIRRVVPNDTFLHTPSFETIWCTISLVMVHFPSVALVKHSKFVEVVKRDKEFGFDPLKITFVMAFPNIMNLSKEMVTKKMTFLVKDMGLSSKDIVAYPPILPYNLDKKDYT
ncbi:hypothetical protein CR513_35594, partial [Mucuna pruriens]